MSGFNEQEGFYQTNFYDNQNYSFDANTQSQFGQEQQFGQFDYNYGVSSGYGGDRGFGAAEQSMYTGSILTPSAAAYQEKPIPGVTEEDEPPLLEELGINFDHIVQKGLGAYFGRYRENFEQTVSPLRRGRRDT